MKTKDEKIAEKQRQEMLHAVYISAAPEFKEFGKIGRLKRDIVITEKIDGTNSAVIITPEGSVYAQSRTRTLSPHSDNFGFATWVHQNQQALKYALGEGTHFGEWWGNGIQRGYGKSDRTFSLFNTARWRATEDLDIHSDLKSLQQSGINIDVVPLLYHGPWIYEDKEQVGYAPEIIITRLVKHGSFAAPTWMKPEGVVVYHGPSKTLFKMTVEKDDKHKGEV